MRLCLIALLGAFCLCICPAADSARLFAAERKPNVILIYADDQGSVDANCYGAKDLITPSIDALAKEGVRFTQFYAAAPVCSPSRAAVLTGRVPQRAGVPGNVSSAEGHAGMPTQQVTIAEMLKSAGYSTGHVGKWHLGYTPETMPNGQGFDYSFGHMGGCIDNYSHFFYWNGPNRHDLWLQGKEIWRDGQYFPDQMVEHGKQFMADNAKKPFFLYWAINLPHYPLQGKEKWRKQYEHLPSPRNKYAAFISSMDEAVGELLADSTSWACVKTRSSFYQSDHGHSTEERTRRWRQCRPVSSAVQPVEGGIRVPAIISWPGKLPTGQVRIEWRRLATGCRRSPICAVSMFRNTSSTEPACEAWSTAVQPPRHIKRFTGSRAAEKIRSGQSATAAGSCYQPARHQQ